MNCLLVLSLAVLGASAAPCGLNLNVVSGCASALQGRTVISQAPFVDGLGVASGCASPLQGRTVFSQTPVIENPTAVFPSYVPTSSVSESCHCLKTVVRPQIRNEVITVPSVDRVVRVVPSPVVEAVSVNVGGNTRNFQIPTCGGIEGVSGIVGSYPRIVEGVVGGSLQGFGGVVSGGSLQGFGGVVGGVIAGTGCGSSIVV